jgi:predicted phosphodiesterase
LKYLVISDIHGNLPALEAVLKISKGDYDAIINLGDVVNYGPWSNECVQLLDCQPNCISLLGNHEEYFLKGAYKNPGKVSEVFFEFCYPSFTAFDSIKQYKTHYQKGDVKFIHTIRGEYIFKDSLVNTTEELCLGHSHQQFCNTLNKHKIYNPGSVGQNRAWINAIEFAFFEEQTSTFEFKQITYNVNSVIKEMESRNYPQVCIDYYRNKKQLVC